MSHDKFYTTREENLNYMTHAFGVLIALVATYFFIKKALAANDNVALYAYSLFGLGMLACMLASTLYHFIRKPAHKSKLRHFDHASIYILIAASYTPFTNILLRDERVWGFTLFLLIWLIAGIGVVMSFRKLKRNSHIKTASYVLMGLVVLIAFRPLINAALSKDAMDVIVWLFIGGLFYIIGAVIYALAKKEFAHAVFHVFVLLGMVSHVIAVFRIPL